MYFRKLHMQSPNTSLPCMPSIFPRYNNSMPSKLNTRKINDSKTNFSSFQRASFPPDSTGHHTHPQHSSHSAVHCACPQYAATSCTRSLEIAISNPITILDVIVQGSLGDALKMCHSRTSEGH